MTKYIIKRLLGVIPTMFIIITVSFFIIRLAPGGPFSREKKLPETILANIQKKYNMDKPLFFQYTDYLLMVVKGDLGPSYRYSDHNVNELIAVSLPNSLFLGFMALILSVLLGIPIGMISAIKQNTWGDYLFTAIASLGITVPLFVVGPFLMLIFAMWLKWLPTSGWITDRAGAATLIMPLLTLTFPYFADIARLSRASLLEVLRSDYIRTARAKGLSERVVLFKHALKGAMLPVVSYMGPTAAGIVTGSIVVESIFRVPGIGRFFVQSALNRDYTLIMGTVIVYSLILILMNLVVDIVYGFIDPRITYK